MKGKVLLVVVAVLLNVLVIVAILPQTFEISRAATNQKYFGSNVNPDTACPPSPSPAPTPTPTTGNCMTYHGNLIMTGNINVYIINWFDNKQPPFNYVSLIQRFYNDLSGTQGGQTFYDIMNQYPDHTGSYPIDATLAGTWEDDSTPYPICKTKPCQITTADTLAEVETAMSQNPLWPQTGSYTNYFVVYTLDGVASANGCGFHNASSVSGNTPIIFGDINLPVLELALL